MTDEVSEPTGPRGLTSIAPKMKTVGPKGAIASCYVVRWEGTAYRLTGMRGRWNTSQSRSVSVGEREESYPRLAPAGAECGRYPLSHHHHTLIQQQMGLRDLLRLPRKHRRTRSEVMSEVTSTEGRRVGLAVLPHSQPDLGIGYSISQGSVPSTSQKQEPGGM